MRMQICNKIVLAFVLIVLIILNILIVLIIDFSPLVFLSIWLHGMVIIYSPFGFLARTKFSHSNIGPDSVDHAKTMGDHLFCIVFPRFMHFLIARQCSCEFQFEKNLRLKN